MTVTLQQLLAAPALNDVRAKLLGKLQGKGLPTTDWASGGPERTILESEASTLFDLVVSLIPTLIGFGFIDLATGDALTLNAQQRYNRQRTLATNTQGNLLLACVPGAGPYTIQPGTLWFQALSANRYQGPLGVSAVTLRPPGFSAVTHLGGGAGVVTPSGVNNGGLTVTVIISGGGAIGVGTFQWQVQQTGNTAPAVTSAPITIPGGGNYTDAASGITINFSAATYQLGDTFAFQSYGQIFIQVQSELVNHSVPTGPNDTAPLVNYVDAQNTIVFMTTSLAGVTCNNPAPTYSAVTLTGTSSGTLALSGTPVGSHSVAVRIDVSGQSGVASWSFSLDGAAYVSAGAVASASVGSGITVTLVNGGGTPSFNAGDVYGVTAPGGWVTQQGTDQQPDPTLNQACKNQWPSLATLPQIPGSPTLGFYDLLARQPIPPATTSQVTQTLVQQDPNINNQVNVYVAGQAGLLPGSSIAALQARMQLLNMLTDKVVVLSPAALAITLGGATITVRAASLAAAQAALQASIQNYITSLGINASLGDGKIKHGKIIALIEDTFGVTDVTDGALTINGAAQSFTFPVGSVQLPQWSQSVATAFTWVTV